MDCRGIAGTLVALALIAPPAQGFGARGHTLVGAVADHRLAGKPIALKLADLLHGATLAEAALWADGIKDWDKHNPETDLDTFHLPAHAALEKELIAFHKANRGHGVNPNHRDFHFTDVPVLGASTYTSGPTGRSKFDVVHLIPFCAKVLNGTVPEDNDRKITKRVAVILLAHYVGDAHQPLHVGAEYFGGNRKPSNPDTGGGAFADVGGNNFLLFLDVPGDHGHRHASGKLHGFWDEEAVTAGVDVVKKEIRAALPGFVGPISDGFIARRLASQEPPGWAAPGGRARRTGGPVDRRDPARGAGGARPIGLPERRVGPGEEAGVRPGGREGPAARRVSYHDFAGTVTRLNLHKAGWRLADLLEKVIE